MFSKASWRCPKCHAKNVASAEQAKQPVVCAGCGGRARIPESVFTPDVRDFVNATCLALLTDLGGLVSEDAQGEAFHRMLPVLRFALAESEARGRKGAREGLNAAAQN